MSERLRNNCCWSSSRESTFHECQKKYWYSYYGAWEGWPLHFRDARKEVDPLSSYLYRLKNMQPLIFFIGSTVHKVIEETIKESVAKKTLPSLDVVLQKGKALVQKGLKESIGTAWEKNPKKHVRLLEDHYHKEKLSEQTIEEKVTSCLSNWYHSEIVQGMLLHPNTTMGDVEKPMQFLLSPDMECIVVYDLYLYWKRGTPQEKLIIFDWKTGKENDRIQKQLSAYALAAITLLKVPVESIVLSPFYVAEGPAAYKKLNADITLMETTKQEIHTSLQDMKKLHSEPVLPGPELFSCTKNTALCDSCPFQEVCKKASFQDLDRAQLAKVTLC